MKKMMMVFWVTISLVTMVWAWPGQNYEVSTTPIRILPEVNPAVSTAWTTTTAYVTGDYVYVHTNYVRAYYWALSNGTSGASAPAWGFTNDVHDGSTTWRFVNPVRKQYTVENIVGTVIQRDFSRKAEALAMSMLTPPPMPNTRHGLTVRIFSRALSTSALTEPFSTIVAATSLNPDSVNVCENRSPAIFHVFASLIKTAFLSSAPLS